MTTWRSLSLERIGHQQYGTGLDVSEMTQCTVTVISKVCRAKVCMLDDNPTNLFNHFKRKHWKQYAESFTVRGSHMSVLATIMQPDDKQLYRGV